MSNISKLTFVSRIEFIRSKLSNFLLMYLSVVNVGGGGGPSELRAGVLRPGPPPVRVCRLVGFR